MTKNHLTVRELIKLLEKCEPDLLVWHEGCDCWGEADGVLQRAGDYPWKPGVVLQPNDRPPYVLITRIGGEEVDV